ncbi:hypothetical protein KI387_010532, partial [Taxus chinensis]
VSTVQERDPGELMILTWKAVHRILGSFVNRSTISFSHKLLAYKPCKLHMHNLLDQGREQILHLNFEDVHQLSLLLKVASGSSFSEESIEEAVK